MLTLSGCNPNQDASYPASLIGTYEVQHTHHREHHLYSEAGKKFAPRLERKKAPVGTLSMAKEIQHGDIPSLLSRRISNPQKAPHKHSQNRPSPFLDSRILSLSLRNSRT
ncbi:uncharacterized protein BP01DRAFT_203582 [Aspergillus saccharolyticus JOP 1030-1]|uniref:Uncharacterized protein n=1 Tax=Aspergillus saccharolyticus JOP 1030-1 TaxID=1450539 RepID=A0A318Z0B4_9EURO|nr:hypothetical protein BP01DRAFT_203582 [Aspergillus saccharolyticus JOP 1030-1]PYH40721.1 hypothetical protein BP01DRAFT_203582 [Aspergillus saccharolyticus JOP 1030-1]